MADKIFVGRVYDAKFSRGKLVLTPDDLKILQSNMKDGKVSVLIRDSKAGKPYAEIDTWQPQQTAPQASKPKDTFIESIDDVPF